MNDINLLWKKGNEWKKKHNENVLYEKNGKFTVT